MRRLMILASTLSLLLVSGAGMAEASAGSGSFKWEAGAGTVCTVAICPDVAMAGNGDMVTVRAQGNLDLEDGEASGSGTFEHRNSSGALLANGTLTVRRLIAFTLYGCGGTGLPSNFCGGRAKLLVHLVGHPASKPSTTVEANAILIVTCLIGSPPSGAQEGITLNVEDLINFNSPTSGNTLFIQR